MSMGKDNLKINISNIKDGEHRYEFKVSPEEIDFEDEDTKFPDELGVEAKVYKSGNEITADIKLDGNFKFICDRCLEEYEQKFEKKYEKRSFRTGDFGYFEDNLLFFANRKDELIKLHGFRIELGEIDKELTNNEFIEEAITIPLKRGNEVVKLISFIVSKNDLDIEKLKNDISKNLPYYMVPSDIIILDKFSYNANHKIDKNELINIYKNM